MEPLLVRFAMYFATREHGTQLYGGNQPYPVHLAAVAATVRTHWPRRTGPAWSPPEYMWPTVDYVWTTETTLSGSWAALETQVVAAAWLHDVVEDTAVKLKVIEELFGPLVADLVGRVTNEPGENRRVRHALTYPKIRPSPLAVYLKLCDRLANIAAGGRMTGVYAKEHEDFRRALYTPGQHDPLWLQLDTLLGRLPASPTT